MDLKNPRFPSALSIKKATRVNGMPCNQNVNRTLPLLREEREDAVPNRPWTSLPGAHSTPHIWTAKLGNDISPGIHVIEVRATNVIGKSVSGRRVIKVK